MPYPSATGDSLTPGLVSITFRKLSVDEVIELTAKSGLEAIEWGGDVHVPPSDPDLARDIGDRTRAAGLSVYAYGSYYRVATKKERAHSFAQVAAAAAALGTKTIRVWVSDTDSEDADASEWDAAVAELREICAHANGLGLRIGMEFHAGTLNNRAHSSRRLVESVGAKNLTTFWQTTNRADDAFSLESLHVVRDWVSHIHVFNWHSGGSDQTRLTDGTERWSSFLDAIRSIPGDRALGLEFVKGGEPAQLLEDAATLREWLDRA